MPLSVFVHLLPRLIESDALAGGVAVVIDILRASTTIVHALASGAAEIWPCQSIEEARRVAEGIPRDSVLLGGERGGERIEGFDLGNSPLEYGSDRVTGKTVVFTTTNGTRALQRCRTADRVFIGAFVNQSALVRVLKRDERPVHLVCAGTDGQLTAEDILFAGVVASQLTGRSADVQTQMAIDFARARSVDEATFGETIRSSRGGQNLLRLGMEADVERASQRDLFNLVPEWDGESNRITAS